jgi:hypothetical protein
MRQASFRASLSTEPAPCATQSQLADVDAERGGLIARRRPPDDKWSPEKITFPKIDKL